MNPDDEELIRRYVHRRPRGHRPVYPEDRAPAGAASGLPEPKADEEQLDCIPAMYRALAQGTALMLDLVLADGNHVGLPYTYLSAVNLDASVGIVLEYPDRTVTITGRNLRPVYRGILSHTALRLAVAESVMMDTEEGQPLITGITIEKQGDTRSHEGSG